MFFGSSDLSKQTHSKFLKQKKTISSPSKGRQIKLQRKIRNVEEKEGPFKDENLTSKDI